MAKPSLELTRYSDFLRYSWAALTTRPRRFSSDNCPSWISGRRNLSMWPDWVSNPGPLTYETGALPTALRSPASYQSVISEYLLPLIPCTGAVSQYFTLTKVIYKQKKLDYFQTGFTVSKVQSCILVSFVFKLSLRLVGGGQTGTSVNFLKRNVCRGREHQ